LPLRQHPRREARSSAGTGRVPPRAATPPEGPNSRGLSPAAPAGAGPPPGGVRRPRRTGGAPKGAFWPRALPLRQFHVLFDSLSKVLFIFRSLYLCAIGLWRVFSLGWNLPPVLSCIPKQLDSSKGLRAAGPPARTRGSHPLRRPIPGDLGRAPRRSSLCRLQLGPRLGGLISNLSSCLFTRRYWGNPGWFLFLRLLICLSSAGNPA
jgi:hypothetical protein